VAADSTETSRDLVVRYFDFMNSAEPSLACAIFAQDVVFVGPAVTDGIKGREAFVKFVATMRSATPDLHFTEVESVAEGERLASRFTMSGTYRPEGGQEQPFSTDGMDLFHIRHGRIEQINAYFDRLGRADRTA
jgi:steroid delta-isomerase-like uncharacterized protein